MSFSSIWSITALSPAAGAPIQISSSCIDVTTDIPIKPQATTDSENVVQEIPSSKTGDVEKPVAAAEDLGSIVCIIADDGVRA